MKITPIQLAKRVEAWQKRLALLGVSHFTITAVHCVDTTPGGTHAEASVFTPRFYDNAEFWFKWEFLEECDERSLDQTIVHEWLHVAFRDLDQAIEAVQSWMPERTYDDFNERVKHENEGVIERLARLIIDQHYGTG